MNRKTVLITGSSRGIGKAIAFEFAKNDFNVAINCKTSKEELENTLNEIKIINENVIAIQKDVSNYNECKNLFSEIEKKFGMVDILINNAGISNFGLFTTLNPCDWDNIIKTNLYSVFNCSYLALPNMINKKNGSIINISSIWGEFGASCEVIYSASKGGINSFTKALAKEVAPSNIRVNAVSCGMIKTQMNEFLSKTEINNFIEEIPLMRAGKPEEVAKTTLFLSSENSSYLTGKVITLDGGMY